MKSKVDVVVAGLTFSVDVDGRIEQPQSVPPQVLDEVRLAASGEFRGMWLPAQQYRYWQAVGSVNEEHKRFASGRSRRDDR